MAPFSSVSENPKATVPAEACKANRHRSCREKMLVSETGEGASFRRAGMHRGNLIRPASQSA